MQDRAHGGNEERRGERVAIEQIENAREPGLRAEIGGGKRGGRSLSAGQQIRFVVDVEAQADGDARVVRPGLWA